MSLRNLRTLIAVADYGSFAAAAEAVHVSQSAVSMQMRALEDELRAELFDRNKRPPCLNVYGRQLVQRAREIVLLYDQMIDAAADARFLAGKLTLGAVPTTLTGIVPQALAAMRSAYPNLQISLVSGLSADLVALLGRGEVDAAVISEPQFAMSGLEWKPIASEQLIVIAPIEAAGTTPRDILETLPYIRFNRQAWVGRIIESYLRDQNITVQVSMELDTLEAISMMVYHGLGASVVPLRCVEQPYPLPLKRLPLGGRHNTRTLGFAEPSPNPKPRLTSALYTEFARLGRRMQSDMGLGL